jgi:hypothetical protein
MESPVPDLGSIGPYRLLRKLGEGGMGEVWLAEQSAPVKRQVALKIIKAGRYDQSALIRFDLERQALAMMDHPAIAKVFDAGSTAQGQPYFAMEYVQGLGGIGRDLAKVVDMIDRVPMEDRDTKADLRIDAGQDRQRRAVSHAAPHYPAHNGDG